MDVAAQIGALKKIRDSARSLNLSNEDDLHQWHSHVEIMLRRTFLADSKLYKNFSTINWDRRVFIGGASAAENLTMDLQAREEGRKQSIRLFEYHIFELDQYGLDEATHVVEANRHTSAVQIIERLCNRFHLVVEQLRRRHEGRPTLEVNDEYDVQDLMHACLLLDFDDVRTEQWTPSYAGASSRIDFLLKREHVGIEVKRSRAALTAKKIGEELMIDVQRYQTHGDCKMLVCFVYDPERSVLGPRGIEDDLSNARGGLPVKVFIRPT